MVTNVEERWWLMVDVEEEEGVEGRWLDWCCQNMVEVGRENDVHGWTSKGKHYGELNLPYNLQTSTIAFSYS